MEEKRKPRPCLMWVVVGLTMLVGYTLSEGPMYFLIFGGYIPPSGHWLLRLYDPLVRLGELVPFIRAWDNWYCNQWLDRLLP